MLDSKKRSAGRKQLEFVCWCTLLLVSCGTGALSPPDSPIESSPIVIIEPLAGAELRVGDTVHIRWSCDTLTISDVNVVLSVDNGEHWLLINQESSVSLSNQQWSDFPWVVPESYVYPAWLPEAPSPVQIAGRTARIKVYKYEYPEIFGLSGELNIVQ